MQDCRVLIKSVLTTLPIYHMASAKLPAHVVKVITDKIIRFFWGKHDEGRYLAYVAWEKISRPLEMGGLGIRDLSVMNNAMTMKFLWRVAAGSKASWVQLVQAKYIPRSDLWQTKRTYMCSVFWRSIMRMRESLLPMLSWKVGGWHHVQGLCTTVVSRSY